METEPIIWELRGLGFNGVDSQLVVPWHPLAGAEAFTIEARFLVESGGAEEQRFVHVQGEDGSRALLELRSSAAGWYADTFVHFAEGERFLNDPQLLHPFGEWQTLALVYSGTELCQYVNGELELRGPVVAGRLSAGCVSLGMRLNAVSPFKGRISAVRFSKAALAAEALLRP
jgi:hypothetical protein